MDETRRKFLKKVAAYGWATPVILTVLSKDARADLSGFPPDAPPCDPDNPRPTPKPRHRGFYQRWDHRPWWRRLIGGRRHTRRTRPLPEDR